MVRISNVSTITFRSDVSNSFPRSTGILHAVRSDDGEEHIFCWIPQVAHMERAVNYFIQQRFHKDSLVFVPYSSRENWVRRYPLAALTCECTEEGEIVDRFTNANSIHSNHHSQRMSSKEPMVHKPKAAITLPTITIEVERRTRRDFDEYLDKLIEFKEEHGHADVPIRYDKDLKLGKWVNNIRTKKQSLRTQGLEAESPKPHKNSSVNHGGALVLTKERIDLLDSIGFSWDLPISTPRFSWDDRFQELMEYYRVNGRWPPHTAGPLGEWVHKQRVKWAKRDKAFMEKHYEQLEEVGFLWKMRDRQKTVSWETRFEQLAEFGRINGHFDVPNPCDDESVGHKKNC